MIDITLYRVIRLDRKQGNSIEYNTDYRFLILISDTIESGYQFYNIFLLMSHELPGGIIAVNYTAQVYLDH